MAFHSSNAHWLRSAACPAAQVAATLPSSGVSTRSPPSPCGAGPAYPSPGGSGSVVGRPGSPLASRAWPSIRQASQWQPSSWGSTADLCRPHLVNLSSRTAHSYSAQGHSCIRSWGPSRLRVRASWAAGAALLAVLPATGPTLERSSGHSLLRLQLSRCHRPLSHLQVVAPSDGEGSLSRAPLHQ